MNSIRVIIIAAVIGLLTTAAMACQGTPTAPADEASPEPAATAEPSVPTTVEVLAPIEDVSVSSTASAPPEYIVTVRSGLPDGCHSFNGYEVSRSDNVVKIKITNLKPADRDVLCTMVYGTIDTSINIGTDFDPEQDYSVEVNGVSSDLRPATERVSEAAPIESVQIVAATGGASKSELLVVSGLPNTCYELEGHQLTRDDEAIRVDVTNSRLSDLNVGCAEIYRTVESRIDLGGGIEACRSYTVVANGRSQEVQAFAPNVRCRAPGLETGGVPTPPTLAPIESVSVRTTRSIPAQYTLVIRSGLPNACVKFGGYSIRRAGDTILVAVTNLPPQQGVMCAQVYGTVETFIDLGTDFYRGRDYTVEVNELTETFTGVNSPPDEGAS